MRRRWYLARVSYDRDGDARDAEVTALQSTETKSVAESTAKGRNQPPYPYGKWFAVQGTSADAAQLRVRQRIREGTWPTYSPEGVTA